MILWCRETLIFLTKVIIPWSSLYQMWSRWLVSAPPCLCKETECQRGWLLHWAPPSFFNCSQWGVSVCGSGLPKHHISPSPKQHNPNNVPTAGVPDLCHMLAVQLSLGNKTYWSGLNNGWVKTTLLRMYLQLWPRLLQLHHVMLYYLKPEKSCVIIALVLMFPAMAHSNCAVGR